jgi:two-component system response regulator HydG
METLQRKSNSIHPKSQLGNIVIGKSEASTILHNQIKLIAATELSVIIEGESGTGKENIARQIHQQSARANKPFVAVDCGTLSANLAGSELFGHVKGAFTGAIINKKGSMEMAQGGTLFLDEIGNLSYEVQVKLLRVIQERTMLPVGGTKSIDLDIRILVATNDVLKQSFKNGSFREDLYHRLNEFKIEVPALRNRQEDFPIFIAAFLEDANVASNKQVSGLSDELFQILTQYDWPGNIRELKNIIRRLVLLTPSGLAQKESLPSEMLSDLAHKTSERQLNLKENQTELEKELIEKTLLEVKFNKTKAAKLLNIDRSTLYAKMEKYNIQ